ncbi:copper-translocating P-type ATPase [Cyclobacterium qasimii]|uniref:Lead, cadmium, zinc and mercury transporting ATPase n=2 Tax=Cyclobacterium qasimii TaxID=1350429 RepID=S7WP31_9BACT|nr:copper-translocating P-type ATPase [Cyclobacterium qasimii]EPR68479.1 Lead, cadmium, zinc and mercury transporting ATPase [Cyclobacterium qasimii M12-11B]GEO23731.1 heavy metal translocating P-type ATPase [Cyclobacterium qasimii]
MEHTHQHDNHKAHDMSKMANEDKHGNHDHSMHHMHMIMDFKKRFWVSLLITLPIIVMAPMIQELLGYEFTFPGDRYVQFGLSTLVFFYGGWPFLTGLVDELKKKSPGMMTLIALAISVAYFYSSAVVFGLSGKIFFWELVSLIDIMLLGHWIEMKSVMGASNALQELAKMMPSEARRIKANGETEEVPVADLQEGDTIQVRPGEKIPADGIILEGSSHVNESMLTGESKPVEKQKEDEVIGGSINDNGVLKIKVRHTGKDSYLSKVIGLVTEAQQTKSKSQNLANRAAGWLFYIALGAGIVTLIVWLSLGKEFDYALERMVTVMIISCPHALGLAVPLVVAISTSVSAKHGLLIRNRTAFENSRKLTTIIFDKTGTLTKGAFGVTRYESVTDSLEANELLRLAASLESVSEHPIAAGIVRKAKELELKLSEPQGFENITGRGIKANLEGKEFSIVSPGSLKKEGIDQPEGAFRTEDETVVFVLSEGKLIGYIALADEIREESKEAIQTLKKQGLKVLMATGDNEKVAKAVSETLELDGYFAEVLPEDKQKIIKDLQGKGEFVAMTGDGVNDAPALAQADVGIAVGSGTDVAAETADIILVNSNPKDIASLILFGTATYRKMMQNIWWAAGYNILAVPLAAGVLAGVGIILSPAIGAALMSLSTVIVALNAQLLRKQIKI